MSWRYKLYNIEPEQVVTIDPINENFSVVMDEFSSGLNEHNLRTTAFDRKDFAEEGAFILHLSQKDDIGLGFDGYDDPTTANWVTIFPHGGWQAFAETDKGLALTFTAKGGTAYLCASLNIHCGSNSEGRRTRDPDLFQGKGFGYLVALRLNGSVLHESLLGSGDPGEDDFRQRQNTLAAMRYSAGDDEGDWKIPDELAKPQGGGGLSGARLPVVVDAVVELLPGQNVVEVVVMNIEGSMRSLESSFTWIGQRELFVLEMVR